MKMINNPSTRKWPGLIRRPEDDDKKIGKAVRKILELVREDGDKALLKLNRDLDKVKLSSLRVTQEEIEQASSLLDEELLSAIRQAKANIERFHLPQRENPVVVETAPGIRCWRKSVAIERIGLYIPGGSAPLFSTVLMLAIPAAIAGCREIVLCTPPQTDGSIHPAILYSSALCGVTTIIKTGGAQAIAAMAYGTESVPRVFKILGPGNRWVTKAKQLVQDKVAIDMPAGPSELLVIADETANPAYVAADLLSQAEHGPDSQVVLVTTSPWLAEKVDEEVKQQLDRLPRKEMAMKALRHSRILVMGSLDKAIAFSNRYAPEHLILACENAVTVAERITAAGSVFIGNYSPESAGDYASGTNHTLPTNGYAAMYSGVSVDSFVKKITFQELSRDGLAAIGDTVMTMAAAEGLEAHRQAVAIRLTQTTEA